MSHFAHTDMVAWLWVIPVALVLALWALRARAKALARLGPLASERVSRNALGVHRWRLALTILGASLCLAALAQPRWGYHWQELRRKGIDLVLVLDVSASMDAEDVRPSRMERARRELLDLSELLIGDRVGLVVFAGGAQPRMPLTVDYGALRWLVRDTSTTSLRAGGSDLGAAIDAGVALLGHQDTADRALLVISDGEDHADGAVAAAERAAAAGVYVYSMGIGTTDGAPVPNAEGGFKTDGAGKVVISRLDEDLLKAIAQAGRGAYVRAGASADDVRGLYQDQMRGRLEGAELGVRRERVWHERFQWVLGPGLLLLMLAFWRRPGGLRMPGAAAALVLGLGLGTARAQDAGPTVESLAAAQAADPDNPDLAEALGHALYQSGERNQAVQVWRSLAARTPDPAQAERARYNAGVAAAQSGRLVEALDDFNQVLESNPDHAQAQQNAGAVGQEIMLRMQEPPPEEQPQDGGEDGEQGDSGQPPDQEGDPSGAREGDGSEGGPSEAGEQDPQEGGGANPETAPQDDGTRPDPTEGEGQGEAEAQEAEAQATEAGGSGQGEEEGEAAAAIDPDQEISPDQADRLFEGVQEGAPRVKGDVSSSGGKDW